MCHRPPYTQNEYTEQMTAEHVVSLEGLLETARAQGLIIRHT